MSKMGGRGGGGGVSFGSVKKVHAWVRGGEGVGGTEGGWVGRRVILGDAVLTFPGVAFWCQRCRLAWWCLGLHTPASKKDDAEGEGEVRRRIDNEASPGHRHHRGGGRLLRWRWVVVGLGLSEVGLSGGGREAWRGPWRQMRGASRRQS